MEYLIRGKVGHINLMAAIENLENHLNPLIKITTLDKSTSEPEKSHALKIEIMNECRKLNPDLVDNADIFQFAISIYTTDLKHKKHTSQINFLKSHLLLCISHIEMLKAKYPQEFSNNEPTDELIKDLMDTAIFTGKTVALSHLKKIEIRFSRSSEVASLGGKAKNKYIPQLKTLALELIQTNRPNGGWENIINCIEHLALAISQDAEAHGIPAEEADYLKLINRIQSWRSQDPKFKEEFNAAFKKSL